MAHNILLGIVVFLLTIAETAVSTFEGRHDRQSTASRTNKHSLKAAHWAAVFEAILLLDIVLLVHEPWVFGPVIVGAWIGKYWSVEKRRKKFRRKTKQPASEPGGS